MATEEAPIFDPTMKKKKKKVKKFDIDDEGAEDEQGTAQEQNVEAPNEPTEGTVPETKAPETQDQDVSDKNAKKTVKFAEGEVEIKDEEEDDEVEIKYEEPRTMKYSDANATWLDSERDYTYDELLERVFNIMRERNPDIDSGGKRKFVMKPPQVLRVGTKKTSFANFKEICRLLRRDPRHLLAFLLAELGTSGSVDGNDQLIIKGRFQQKQIESILRHYIKEYVTCHTCKSPETRLEKEERLFFLQCEVCQSRCSVASIKSGFQAVTARRAQMRAKVA